MKDQRERCLVCLRWDGPFTGVEHILPEGSGNKGFILPKGVVCDPCNNGQLSIVDQTFLGFVPIALLLVTNGIRTKSGALPKVKFGNAHIEWDRPDHITMFVNSRKAWRPIPGGVNTKLTGRPMTPRYTADVTRFLFKAALEFAYLDQGPHTAFSPMYDEVREIVRGRAYHGFLAFETTSTPAAQVSFTHHPAPFADGRAGIGAWIDVYGFRMGTELLVREPPNIKVDGVQVIRF